MCNNPDNEVHMCTVCMVYGGKTEHTLFIHASIFVSDLFQYICKKMPVLGNLCILQSVHTMIMYLYIV